MYNNNNQNIIIIMVILFDKAYLSSQKGYLSRKYDRFYKMIDKIHTMNTNVFIWAHNIIYSLIFRSKDINVSINFLFRKIYVCIPNHILCVLNIIIIKLVCVIAITIIIII